MKKGEEMDVHKEILTTHRSQNRIFHTMFGKLASLGRCQNQLARGEKNEHKYIGEQCN